MTSAPNLKTLSEETKTKYLVLLYILAVFLTGLFWEPMNQSFAGLIRILQAPSVLITDYTVVGGVGGALINAAGVALISYLVLQVSRVSFDGKSIAAVFMTMGFALLGKNLWSVLPIIGGVYIYDWLTGREFASNVHVALFGTCLAPVATQIAFGFGWGVPGGILCGLLAGIAVAPMSAHTSTFHAGYSFYNTGFAAGVIGLVFANIVRGYGFNIESLRIWGTETDTPLAAFAALIFASMLILGLIMDKDGLKNYSQLFKPSPTLQRDFLKLHGPGVTFINMGAVGFMGIIYIILAKANFNGPTLAGLFTMVGFAAWGKHPLNIAPVMSGVWLGSLFSIHAPNAPGAILAALFGTALAPISDQFGPLAGLLAGFIHIFVVSITGITHAGLDLYNNGFSAGFVAAFIVAMVKGFKKEDSPRASKNGPHLRRLK